MGQLTINVNETPKQEVRRHLGKTWRVIGSHEEIPENSKQQLK